MAQSQGTLKDRNHRGNQVLALGDMLVVVWGHSSQSHLAAMWVHGGTGDMGTGTVTLQCPRDGRGRLTPLLLHWPRGHGKGCAPGRGEGHPAPVPSCSRHCHGHRDEPPEHWVNWEKHGCHWGHTVPIAPLGARHLPDAGVPPGRAPAARQHLPAAAAPPAAPVPAAWPSPAAAEPARHRVMPSRSPLFSCLCFMSPMVPGTQSRIVAPPAPRVMPAAVPGPVPPALTPLPPQGTAPSPRGGQGGHEPPPRGWCRIKPSRLGDGLSALITAERCRMAGGAGGRYK